MVFGLDELGHKNTVCPYDRRRVPGSGKRNSPADVIVGAPSFWKVLLQTNARAPWPAPGGPILRHDIGNQTEAEAYSNRQFENFSVREASVGNKEAKSTKSRHGSHIGAKANTRTLREH